MKELFDLLHKIVDKLNIHDGEKTDLHSEVDAAIPLESTDEKDNGNADGQ